MVEGSGADLTTGEQRRRHSAVEMSRWRPDFQKRKGLEAAAGCMFLDLKDNEIRLALCSN